MNSVPAAFPLVSPIQNEQVAALPVLLTTRMCRKMMYVVVDVAFADEPDVIVPPLTVCGFKMFVVSVVDRATGPNRTILFAAMPHSSLTAGLESRRSHCPCPSPSD